MRTSHRERISLLLTVLVVVVFAAAMAGRPHHEWVDGREIVDPVLLGHVVPRWRFLLVAAPLIGVIWFGIDRLLARLWPERKRETEDLGKLYARRDGGFVAWRGDDPEASSPLDYEAPRVKTALEYLQAKPPAPVRVLLLGLEGSLEEERAFDAELARWLKESSDETLGGLMAAARALGPKVDDTAALRLMEAHEARGLPTLGELTALAEELDNEGLRAFVTGR